MRGAILANEVLDALPCQRIVMHGGNVRELGVSVESAARFIEREAPARADVAAAWRAVRGGLPYALDDGYRTELCTRIEPWLAGLSDSLEQGLILLFDYGLPRAHYYHPQRTDGTLRCHFKQRAHNDPLINVGVQDITAWVDFTHVAEGADNARLDVAGFATQAAFLLGLGIEGLIGGDLRLASEARKLLMPGEMGEAFKAMALTRALEGPLSGFSVQDLRHSL
jgi:SAM-dependent MidA family methyltransferase